MIKRIKINGEEVDLTIKDLCHKKDFGNYKLTIEKKIEFDLEAMSKKLSKDFEIDKLHKLFMIIKKPPLSISIARHGRIMIEKVVPDTPDTVIEIAEKVLQTIPGYEGIIE
ncbi:MAG: hypothetical protein E3J87_02935 [Candidatus Cloacimonadota bacterium]|nr:MAG: hypothetical protein E3J87_02935 [Candidatus Cloacimonadota bacterium]